jgi:hypothetical protein
LFDTKKEHLLFLFLCLIFSWRLAFGVWRLAFGVWRLAFGVWRLAVQLSSLITLPAKIYLMRLLLQVLSFKLMHYTK